MSHGSHGTHDTHHGHDAHHDSEPHEKPKPEPILKERKRETLDDALEAFDVANEFLMEIVTNYEKLLSELILEGISSDDLEDFFESLTDILEFLSDALMNLEKLFREVKFDDLSSIELVKLTKISEDLIHAIELEIKRIQKLFDEIPEEMRPLFDAIDFAKEARKKERLEAVKGVAVARKEKIEKEKNERSREDFEKSRERLDFVQNFENSGLSVKMLLDVVSKIDPHGVEIVVDEIIVNYETKPLSPPTKHKIVEEQAESGEVWEEIKRHESDVQIFIDQVESQREITGIEQRFQANPQNQSQEFKKLRQSFQLMQDLLSDPQRLSDLKRTNKLAEAEALQTEAAAKLSKSYKEELEEFRKKEEHRIDEEVARLEKNKFEKRRQAENTIRHDVQKDLPEQIVREVMKSPIDLKEVSVALAERILKEKHGIENIDMGLVFSLPKSVLDAVVDTLTYDDIGKFMVTSAKHPENLPPIYWSESFEKKLKSLHERFDELKKGSLLCAVEDDSHLSAEQKKFVEQKRKDFFALHKAYQTSNILGDHAGQKRTSGQYNEFFVPELTRLLEMKRIREALCGQIPEEETSFTIAGKDLISLRNGKLVLNKKPFPDSHDNTGSAPINFHRPYGYTAAERVDREGLPKRDFEKAVQWFDKLYVHQVVGREEHLDTPVSYRGVEAQKLRSEAKKFDQGIEGAIHAFEQNVMNLKQQFEGDIESFEETRMLYSRDQLKDLKEKVVQKTKEIAEQFQQISQKEEEFFQDNPRKSIAERQLLEAKRSFFQRSILKLQDTSYRPVERVVGMTKEDYIKGYKVYKEGVKNLEKENEDFEEKTKNLEEELNEKQQKLKVLEEVVYENIMAHHEWRFWERTKVGQTIEFGDIETVDPVTGVVTTTEGFFKIERPMKKKEFEALKAERDAIKERILPVKKGQKSALQVQRETLLADHEKRKQEIQKGIDDILKIFPLISVIGDVSKT